VWDNTARKDDPRDDAAVSSVWRSFVPEYVARKLIAHEDIVPGASTERTDAVVLFADVVGFTQMSEALARAGSYGTEELTRILNGWFGAMADCISGYGGSIVEFAGDALTAVFRYERRTRRVTTRRAVQCALDMQEAVAMFGAVVTRAGTFGLAIKVGLGAGPVLLSIMGDPAIRLQPVLTGQALDRAAAAEHQAHSGEVIVDGGLLKHGLAAQVLERRGGWHVVCGLRQGVRPVRPSPPGDVQHGAASRLAPFFHPVIAERLHSGRHELFNEHRQVTSVFIGLPDLAADDPRAVASLQRHVAVAVRVIDRYGGHLRQVASGDKGCLLVAFFGAPVSHEDDEERAVRCCLELLQLPGGPFRAGVTSGSVYCGEIGSDIRREYAVIGDSVNLAARLMEAATPGQLLIDQSTHERVRETVIQDGLKPMAVKGKVGRIETWAVRAMRDQPQGRPPNPVTAQALLGRSAAVARARTLVERALAGEGQVVCLSGNAGIGKSRLAAEVLGMAEGLGFVVYGGACRSHGTTTSYLVWRPIWRALLELDVSLPVADQQAALVEAVRRRDGSSSQLAPLLAPVVNLTIPDSELTAAIDQQSRDELLRSLLLNCLRARARTGPVVLALEDCHWIDSASRALLEFLGRNVVDQPVLMVVTARRTAADAPVLAPLLPLAHVTEERLTELARGDAERLVGLRLRQRYGTDAIIAPEVVHQVAERGEGNPFYLEELVSFLHGRSVDPRDPRALTDLELPDGLQRLVMARIDQLSEGENATIKVASVIGRRFRANWISQAYPSAGGPQEVALHLDRLDELDLTPRLPAAPEPEYEFKHAITQEAAYQSMTYRMREKLHERVGLLIELTFPDHLAQYVDVLAHHYGRTHRVDKQRVWFRAAGDAAKAAYANVAAVEHYERLLPLLAPDETGEVLVELGAVWQLTGRWTEAERAYRKAMEIASGSGRREILAASQRDLGDLFMFTQSYAEAVGWLTRAAEEFERLGDRSGLSRTLDRITYALYRQGTYDQALAAAERHFAIATEAGDPAGMSIALNHTGLVRMNTGQTAEALGLLRRALDTAAEAGDRRCLLHAANNLGLVYWRSGDHIRAVTCWHQALRVARQIGDRQTAGIVIGNMGEVYLEQGDQIRAAKCFVHALRIGVELRDGMTIADQVANLAATATAHGRLGEAERLYSQAIALARILDAPYFLCGSLHQLAKLHVAQGRLHQADRLNLEALQVANEHSEHDVRIRADLLSVRLQVALGRMGVEAAVERLRALERARLEPYERAVLLDTLWYLDPNEEAGWKAAEQYRILYDRAPSVEHREAYARLTGMKLPPGPLLPSVPEEVEVEVEVVDFPGLLREVDRATSQLRAR
jgi:class 3 adenylate cyclase/tetratricopeptide (TPR) repeat protein